MSIEIPTCEVVRSQLDGVTDPELDRSIVELDYIKSIDIDDNEVAVRFTLPTAWCSPTFAWMMAEDARNAVSSLDNVSDVTIELLDHMHAEEINHGVNEGVSFDVVFEDADDTIDDIRQKFENKARIVRQYTAIDTLRTAGLTDQQVVDIRKSDIEFDTPDDQLMIRLEGLYVCVDADPLLEYLAKAKEVGIGTHPDERLFRTSDGDPIKASDLDKVQAFSRLARANMGGQESICSSLHQSRNPNLAEQAD
jgi:metal-sulfur cluster biosynthetic enzyme